MTADTRPLGVICAMPEEIDHLAARLEGAEAPADPHGFGFRRGRLEGRPVVLVESGLGKVSAAIVATRLIDRFDCRALLLSGVAGGLDPGLGIGDVIVAERLIQHDYGALVGGRLKPYRPGVLPLGESRRRLGYDLDPALKHALGAALAGVALPPLSAVAAGGTPRTPRWRFGTVVTGDQFVNCEATRLRLFETFAAQAVEMEGGAVAQVAERFAVPCVVVRALTDLAGADSHLDFMAFLHAAAETAAGVVRRILPAL